MRSLILGTSISTWSSTWRSNHYQRNTVFNFNPQLLPIWGNCIFPNKIWTIFHLRIFREIETTTDPPWPLYEVNFLGSISSTFLDFLDNFWVEDHLLQTYFNFQYPRFTQNVPVKRNQVTKNCTSHLFILRFAHHISLIHLQPNDMDLSYFLT